jgi:hypothetical protein
LTLLSPQFLPCCKKRSNAWHHAKQSRKPIYPNPQKGVNSCYELAEILNFWSWTSECMIRMQKDRHKAQNILEDLWHEETKLELLGYTWTLAIVNDHEISQNGRQWRSKWGNEYLSLMGPKL